MSKDSIAVVALIVSVAALANTIYISGEELKVEKTKVVSGAPKEQRDEILQLMADPDGRAAEEMRRLKEQVDRLQAEVGRQTVALLECSPLERLTQFQGIHVTRARRSLLTGSWPGSAVK